MGEREAERGLWSVVCRRGGKETEQQAASETQGHPEEEKAEPQVQGAVLKKQETGKE